MGLTRKAFALLAVTFLAQNAGVSAQSLVSTYINVTGIPSKPTRVGMHALSIASKGLAYTPVPAWTCTTYF